MIRVEAKAAKTPAHVTTGEIIAPFDYKSLPRAQAKMAREAADFIESSHRSLSASVLEIGQKLIDVKAALGHGNFTAWVSSEFTMTIRTAQSYMAAATGVGSKSEIVSHLPVMTLLEVAKAPEPVRAKVLDQMTEAHKAKSPLPVEQVKDALHTARMEQREAEREAKLSPAQKARRKAEREKAKRDQTERAERLRQEREAEEAANSKVAVMVLERFGKDAPLLIDALKGTTFSNLAHWLKYPYGADMVNYIYVARKKPNA